MTMSNTYVILLFGNFEIIYATQYYTLVKTKYYCQGKAHVGSKGRERGGQWRAQAVKGGGQASGEWRGARIRSVCDRSLGGAVRHPFGAGTASSRQGRSKRVMMAHRGPMAATALVCLSWPVQNQIYS
jgi:hypothetical protein